MHSGETLKPQTPHSPEGTQKQVHLDNTRGTGGGIRPWRNQCTIKLLGFVESPTTPLSENIYT